MIRRLLTQAYRVVPRRLLWRSIWLSQAKFNLGVAGVLFDAEGRVLLVEHVFRHHYPWGLPSGWVTAKEDVAQALQREVYEETKLACRVDGLLGIESGFHMRCTVVLVGVCAGEPQATSLETTGARFFAPSELPEGLLPSSRAHLERAVQARQKGLVEAGGPWLDTMTFTSGA